MYSNFVRKSVWTHVVTCVYVCMLYCFHHQSECLGLCWPPNVFCRSPTMLQPYPDSAQVMDAPDLTSAVERGVYFNWLLEIVPGSVGNVYANLRPLQRGDQAGGVSPRIPTRSACASLGAMEFAPQNASIRATRSSTSTRAPLPGRPRTSSCCCR